MASPFQVKRVPIPLPRPLNTASPAFRNWRCRSAPQRVACSRVIRDRNEMHKPARSEFTPRSPHTLHLFWLSPFPVRPSPKAAEAVLPADPPAEAQAVRRPPRVPEVRAHQLPPVREQRARRTQARPQDRRPLLRMQINTLHGNWRAKATIPVEAAKGLCQHPAA